MKDERRMGWILEYMHGNASAEVIRELESELKTDPEFRAYFLEYLNVDGGLAAQAAYVPANEGNHFLEFPGRARQTYWASWAKVAAVVTFAGVLFLGWGWVRTPYATVCGSVGTDLHAGARV